jgi:hypothetical protein
LNLESTYCRLPIADFLNLELTIHDECHGVSLAIEERGLRPVILVKLSGENLTIKIVKVKKTT